MFCVACNFTYDFNCLLSERRYFKINRNKLRNKQTSMFREENAVMKDLISSLDNRDIIAKNAVQLIPWIPSPPPLTFKVRRHPQNPSIPPLLKPQKNLVCVQPHLKLTFKFGFWICIFSCKFFAPGLSLL